MGVEVPINQYWPIVRKCLTQGGKACRLCILISTVNNDAEERR